MTSLLEFGIDPYKILNIKDNCHDMKTIRKAYRKKILLYTTDHEKHTHLHELADIEKAYLYLKTLCREIEKMPKSSMIEQLTRNSDNQYRKNENFSSLSRKERVVKVKSPEKTEHQETLEKSKTMPYMHNNVVITNSQFDPDESYKQMMENRPKTAVYQDLENNFIPVENRDRKVFAGKPQNDFVNNELENIQPWGGFDDLAVSNIVGDDQIILIQDNVKKYNDDISFTDSFDGEFTRQTTSKLSENQFKQEMDKMETIYKQKLAEQKQTKIDIINSHLEKLNLW